MADELEQGVANQNALSVTFRHDLIKELYRDALETGGEFDQSDRFERAAENAILAADILIRKMVESEPTTAKIRGAQSAIMVSGGYIGFDMGATAAEPKCRVCGCTDHDCSGCIEKTGERCHWVEPNLCSACLNREEA